MNWFHFGSRVQKIEHYRDMVEEALVSLGYKTPESVETESGFRWEISYGNAYINIELLRSKAEGVGLFAAYSPILRFPTEKQLILPMYRRLLELNNYYYIGPVKFFVYEDVVAVGASKSLKNIEKEDMVDIVEAVSFVADEYNDRLSEEFSAPKIR